MKRSHSVLAFPAIVLSLLAGSHPALSESTHSTKSLRQPCNALVLPTPTSTHSKTLSGDKTQPSPGQSPSMQIACGRPATIKSSKGQQIRFAPGKDSATVKSAVVRGTQNTYVLKAKKGQRMTLKISSLEANAVFALMAPVDAAGKQLTLKSEVTSWSNVLPATGEYTIVISPTRGNATYQLDVAIR